MTPLISADYNYSQPFISDLYQKNNPVPVNNIPASQTGSDIVDISGKARDLFLRKCEEGCEVEWQKQDAEFEFNYSENSNLRITGSGIIYNDSYELDVKAEFTFQSGTAGHGVQAKFFKASLSFHVSVNRNLSVNPFEKKEDILSLVRRVVNTVIRTVLDKDKDLAGIIFDPEDYKELAALEHGAFLKKFEAVIQSIIISTKVLHMIKGEKQGDQILILPKRAKSGGVNIEYSEAKAWGFSLKIEEVQADVHGGDIKQTDQSASISNNS